MNRRSLLLGAGALLVGEPVRRAYSFLQANPLAQVEPAVLTRARMMNFIRAEVERFITKRLTEPVPPTRAELCTAVFNALKPLVPVDSVSVTFTLRGPDQLMVRVVEPAPLLTFDVINPVLFVSGLVE